MSPAPLRRLALAALSALVLALPACNSLNRPFDLERPREASDVPETLALARERLAEGRTDRALQLLGWSRELRGLSPEQRDEVETLIDQVAERRIAELREDPANAKALARLVDLGLPNQLAVAAGVQAARLYLEAEKPYKGYLLLRRLEEKYPRHHGKAEAGSILAEVGLELIDDPSSFLGFFSARDDGIEVLEYLVITYPAEPRCDEAYAALARTYEEDRRWTLARERHEDLRLWHATSPYAARSEAMIPRLRLKALGSPEYERRELLKARFELELWLERHPESELEDEVRADLADCMARLVQNDLGVARFYERIDQYHGARMHAERAARDAREAGLAKLQAEAERLAVSLPDDSRSKTPDAAAFSADDSMIRTTLEERARHEGEDVEVEVQAGEPEP
jgi:hypothetical protein